jgi:hypothetical protein
MAEERSSSRVYPDASCKNAHVPPDLPVPNSECGRPALVFQSRHTYMAAYYFYTCNSFNVSSFSLSFFLFFNRCLLMFRSILIGLREVFFLVGRRSY